MQPIVRSLAHLAAIGCTLGLVLAASACGRTHQTPTTSTETGNPPVIDGDLLALVVTSNEVHVKGEPGAVTPGGIKIHVRALGSDTTLDVSVNADGSFDVKVNGGSDAVYELSAGGGSSAAVVYVAQGGAVVSGNDASNLSCDERSSAAQQLVADVAEGVAADGCSTFDDCILVDNATVCNDSCSEAVVSKTGKHALDEAIAAVESGVCKTYLADGCTKIALPCVANPNPAFSCIEGHCLFVPTPNDAQCPTGCSPGFGDGLCAGDPSCVDCTVGPNPGGSCKNVGQQCSYAPTCGGQTCTCVDDGAPSGAWQCGIVPCPMQTP